MNIEPPPDGAGSSVTFATRMAGSDKGAFVVPEGLHDFTLL
ncbi:MAG: hypothetical protein R5N70_10080 [Cutibacterium granulosum]|nr:hypothetical protein [Cutibacterium granulosum]